MLSTREDHIAPWIATYAATQLYRGDTKFVLAGSGHIAGVVNPPSQQKYGYWTNERLPAKPMTGWTGRPSIRVRGGPIGPPGTLKIRARGARPQPGDGDLKPLEDAPGTYVNVRAE